MHFKTRNVNSAFKTLVQMFRDKCPYYQNDDVQFVECETRNGPVTMIDEVVTITYRKPRERVLFNPGRDANPFFHLYEALWMLAGRNDIAPLDYYLSGKYSNFSDDTVTANGAYGYRWRHATAIEVQSGNDWGIEKRKVDQLSILIDHMKRKPENRRFVLQMWNVQDDLLKIDTSRDVCCNLGVLFSIRNVVELRTITTLTKAGTEITKQYLDMTVFNRSNDLVFGMLGANVVHFSFLQEYMAGMLGLEVGVYNQVTNNLHAYKSNFFPEKFLEDTTDLYNVESGFSAATPLVGNPETFDNELRDFVIVHSGIPSVGEAGSEWTQPFLANVAHPILMCFHEYKVGDINAALEMTKQIEADDWRYVAIQWLETREKNRKAKNATSTST